MLAPGTLADLRLTRPQLGLMGLTLLLGVAIGAFLALPPIAQKAAYHAFHDGRALFGIPNAANVLSNIPFTFVGLLGLRFLAGPSEHTVARDLRPAYLALFVGLTLTGFGSAFYHWAPDNRTLVWDRLPMVIAFMGLFAAMISERIDMRLGQRLLAPLIALGLFSVIHWARVDDLRLYGIVQFYPILAIPVMLAAFRPRYSHGRYVLAAIGCYVVAKLLEDADGHIFKLGELLSGHTLKHLAAATGGWCLYRMMTLRQAVGRIG
jgi:drug/metabolite transporter superfamily protein YnfA